MEERKKKKLRKEEREGGIEREGGRGREEKGRKREKEKENQIPLYFPDIALNFSANQGGMDIVLR